MLQTKKRYVGFMYETPDQKEPVYDAKGIETVRRDSCQAVSKVLERSIKILFQSRDVSSVKSYVQQQCQKMMEGTVSLQDCIFAKEFRGLSGYKPGACVPALEIAKYVHSTHISVWRGHTLVQLSRLLRVKTVADPRGDSLESPSLPPVFRISYENEIIWSQ